MASRRHLTPSPGMARASTIFPRICELSGGPCRCRCGMVVIALRNLRSHVNGVGANREIGVSGAAFWALFSGHGARGRGARCCMQSAARL
jgi:hypothetical protein